MVDKPLRADARRNRARVLETARIAFAAEGLSISPDEIARRAGVGVGTVYRHFPTKEALFEAVVLSRMRSLVEDARALNTAADPGAAFFGYLSELIDAGAAKRDLIDALTGAGVDITAGLSSAASELQDAMGDLLTRAQRTGAVRADIDSGVLTAVLAGAFTAMQRLPDKASGQVFDILCDGLSGRR